MTRSILVPLDGSTFGEHALPLALGLARKSGAVLHLVHVHMPLVIDGIESWNSTVDERLRERESCYLQEVAGRVEKAASVPVKVTVLDGVVPEAIASHAQLTESELIVMTTHGHGPISRFWFGSVADQLMRHAPVPLLLVRPQEDAPDLSRQPPLQHVLIPLDGSELGEQILEPAIAFGKLTGADYTLLRIIQPAAAVTGQSPMHRFGQSLYHQLQELQDQLETEAQIYLERVAERLRAQGLAVQTRVVSAHQTALSILAEARTHAIDLIALETHGRGGLARLFLGSVADKVLRGASTPILVNHPQAAAQKETPHDTHTQASRPPAAGTPSGDSRRSHDAEPDLDPGCYHGQGGHSVPDREEVQCGRGD